MALEQRTVAQAVTTPTGNNWKVVLLQDNETSVVLIF